MNTELEGNGDDGQGIRRVVLVVSKQHVKTVKTALERHSKLDQTIKILPERVPGPQHVAKEQDVSAGQTDHISPGRMRIATTIPYGRSDHSSSLDLEALLADITNALKISHISDKISISHCSPPGNETSATPKNPLHKALQSALSSIADTIFTTSNVNRDALVSSFPDGYSIYSPLLLLPHNALTSAPWTSLLATHDATTPALRPLWSSLASAMNVTHIAMNSPIPLSHSSSSSAENILRSPLNITPLLGDFGTTPTESNKQSPTPQDFDSALWVSTTQNGIHQVWAPLYTMFSRGNIREKTRVFNFPGPSTHPGNEAAVVDMYSGIGYFSFSYKAAGYGPIFCFELNPWSVEGLRRGAVRNNWSYRIYSQHDMETATANTNADGTLKNHLLGNELDEEVDFYIFQTSNTYALPILSPYLHHTNKSTIPPIRHVNLGLLPHSRDSWKDSVALVDMEVGGWIHAHENVGVTEMEERTEEVERVFQEYLDGDEQGKGRKAKVEHVERVKMYAPGVVHVVFDVRIEGTQEIGES